MHLPGWHQGREHQPTLFLTMEPSSLEQSLNCGSWWRPLMQTELRKIAANITPFWWCIWGIDQKCKESNQSHPWRHRCYRRRASQGHLWRRTIVEFPTNNLCQFRSQWPLATHSKPLPCQRDWRTVCPWSTWPQANLQHQERVAPHAVTSRTVLEMLETRVSAQP